MTELNDFLNNILPKIGEESCARIGDTLKENNFTSRLSLKLLSPENLDVLFAEIKLPLGSRKVLEYHLELLKDESPLILKHSRKQRDLLQQQASTNSEVQQQASTNSKVQQQTSTNREEQVIIS